MTWALPATTLPLTSLTLILLSLMVVRGPSGMMSPFLVVACMNVTVESVMLIAVRSASSVCSADGSSLTVADLDAQLDHELGEGGPHLTEHSAEDGSGQSTSTSPLRGGHTDCSRSRLPIADRS